MTRLEIKDGAAQWSKPDSVIISAPKTFPGRKIYEAPMLRVGGLVKGYRVNG
jgi:hypothetical protein